MTAQLTREGSQARMTEAATPAGRGRLREACRRSRLIVQEMSYAFRRVVELQASRSFDKHWHRR